MRWVQGRAVQNGRIELEWLCRPRYEDFGPAPHEGRIYLDAGCETGNTDEHAATAGSTVPAASVLIDQVI